MRQAVRALKLLRHVLALTGGVFLLGTLVFFARPDWLKQSVDALYGLWHDLPLFASPQNTADRATAADVRSLNPRQARVAEWLARKYRVAPEPMAAIVLEAERLAGPSRLPAHLILAVAAIESNFHPFIQSEAGAQGLMQVMPGVHRKRYEAHGGSLTAFDPVVNLRVGVDILQDFIRLRGGSVEEGLKAYLGGVALADDGGYVAKVRAEQARLDRVAAGQAVGIP